MHRSGTVIGASLMHLRILIKSARQPTVAGEKTETQGTCSKYMADLAPELSTASSWMLEVTMTLWWGRSTGREGHTSHPVTSRRIQATRMAIQVRDKESLKQGGFGGGGEHAWEPSRRWADWLNMCSERNEGQLGGLGGDAMRWDGTGEEEEEFHRIWFVTPNLRCPWDGQVMSSHARNTLLEFRGVARVGFTDAAESSQREKGNAPGTFTGQAERERERVNRNAGGATIRVVGGKTGRDSDLEPGTERVLESGKVGGIDSNKCWNQNSKSASEWQGVVDPNSETFFWFWS